jgi:hypothetical protein
MNFLLRPSQNVAAEQPSTNGSPADTYYKSKPAATLEGLIAEYPHPWYSTGEDNLYVGRLTTIYVQIN